MQYVIAFLEGIITFISPCLLPMLPIYISYFAGGGERTTGKTLKGALGFVTGFTVVFVMLGALAGTVGSFLREYQTAVNIVSGLVVVFFGLNFLGVFKLNLFRGGGKSVKTDNMGFFSALLFGMVFSIGWTPCVGAFLGSALMLASQQAHIVNLHGAVGGRTHFGREHEVELTHVGPVACTADGAYNFLVEDNLLESLKVDATLCVHGTLETLMQSIALLLVLQNTLVCSAELCLVELVAETLLCLVYLLLYLIFVLCHLVLDEDISTVTLLRVAIVDERVVEGINVSAGLPGGGVHEDAGIDADNVLVQKHHALPPVLFDVVLELYTILSVIIDSAQTIVNIA